MSVICKSKIVSFEEIVRTVLSEDDLEHNKYLAEFEKYDLIEPFWRMCEENFGYSDNAPSLLKLVYALFVTYASKVIRTEFSQSWKNFCSYKSGNIIAFLDSMMNSTIYNERFDELSQMVYDDLRGDDIFQGLGAENLVDCELFNKVDVFIIQWLIERLENEDTHAKLNGHSIPELCRLRRKMHFGKLYYSHYYIIENAYHLILAAHFEPKKEAQGILNEYITKDYITNQKYRYFYYHFDKIANHTPYEALRELVENIYTNRFLDKLQWPGMIPL
ncbi:MAG: hypothetical protein ACOX5F_06830 [Anaerovoracaceae bacterium]